MRALKSRALDNWEVVPGKSKYRAECALVLNRPNCANVSDEYSAGIESLNIQHNDPTAYRREAVGPKNAA